MAKDSVRVYETGNVNELAVENRGEEAVFIQAGDIVKGGKQDRSLTVSLVLPAHSERIPIASFCVEPGRWSQRGREDVNQFSSAAAAMPSREAKLAMKAPAPGQNAVRSDPASDPSHRPAAETQMRQQRVWDYVASINRELSSNLSRSGGPMPAPSSLQTALEDDKLKTAQQAYIDLLRPAGEKDPDIIGFVFAVNGRVNSGDAYSSNALFRKMWPKLLAASATEAIANRGAGAAPSAEAIRAFVNAVEGGKASVTDLTQHARLETRETEGALYFATAWADGRWVHRNYLAK
jgi:ARG/rhodanese/phosphatase superfamily protein